ncbi:MULTISPECIES: DUF3871 family protein [Flavobacterium]|uniref:DUF3871 family protein n=1 Tax=Flavobacterium gawalongense TaxID=2594432 RepID=A0A553BW68_9FLAO|nr:DUF3871 family protein [Flavobacterium gawalongense]TRX12521.1 DUF3871 family protein [Flavobacterium gawalongense]TRX12658.1 DUF3871 family protein [Flavobacterium gawalongense]TRX30553.1 DUF3871 family protein [Flavobacterium gawalongense]
MNLVLNNPIHQVIDEEEIIVFPKRNFIEANTVQVDLEHLKSECIIPVFAKDNESTISHFEFIKSTKEVVEEILDYKGVLKPEIRVSHQIKGRIPSAVAKPAKELLEHEKTLYYERMAFVIEIPEISEIINGNRLNLTIGGVRSYNQENLFSKKSLERFKIFVGFQNTVCTNLCISTDGLKEDLRVSSILELKAKIFELINNYKKKEHLINLEKMFQYSLTEIQFAHLIGKMKLFPYLSKEEKQTLFPLAINDTQLNIIIRDYHTDAHFSKSKDGTINFWNIYNLATESCKSNYIDSNLERNVNAYGFIQNLLNSIENQIPNYFLH